MYDWLAAVAWFGLGLFAENAGEWGVHKYLLHGLGKRRGGFWSYHLYEHHVLAARNDMIDAGYRGWPLRWNAQGKEALVLAGILLMHLPFFWLAPAYALGLYFGVACYYYRHRRAHLEPGWAQRHMPWHYAHHMQADGGEYWCITWPWFDRLCRLCRPGGGKAGQ